MTGPRQRSHSAPALDDLWSMVNASWLLALITVCCVVCLSSALRIYLLARQVRSHEARQAHVYANQRVSGGCELPHAPAVALIIFTALRHPTTFHLCLRAVPVVSQQQLVDHARNCRSRCVDQPALSLHSRPAAPSALNMTVGRLRHQRHPCCPPRRSWKRAKRRTSGGSRTAQPRRHRRRRRW